MNTSTFYSQLSDNSLPSSGKVTCQSPSNIALIKYWGKTEPQLPKNASISFTLNQCKTITTLTFEKKRAADKDFNFDVIFEGQSTPAFKPKINTFFKRIESYVPFLKSYNFTIESENTFPHSSGIASSASGLSALAMCLMQIEKLANPSLNSDQLIQKASFLARLGSGSAARSLEGPLVVWGKHQAIPNSSDLYGTKYPFEIHPNFKQFNDYILLVDRGEKQVSSTVGHNLMTNHPYAEQRFNQANHHLEELNTILQNGDLKHFIKIVEKEALALHAMMMTSEPYFMLMKPNTMNIINAIWQFRQASQTHICFTLDAGANVHVLFPEQEKALVEPFILNTLVPFCQNNQYICDRLGDGATLL